MEIILGVDQHGKLLHTILGALEDQVSLTDRIGTRVVIQEYWRSVSMLAFIFLPSRNLDLDFRYDQETGGPVGEFPKPQAGR